MLFAVRAAAKGVHELMGACDVGLVRQLRGLEGLVECCSQLLGFGDDAVQLGRAALDLHEPRVQRRVCDADERCAVAHPVDAGVQQPQEVVGVLRTVGRDLARGGGDVGAQGVEAAPGLACQGPVVGPKLGGLGAHLAQHGGVALIIDYGGWRSLGDTFQAVRHHEATDPFAAPGEADLTAHVDFEALTRAAHPAAVSQLIPQGVLLEQLGITGRAQQLAQNLTGATLETHIAAHRRLTHPQEMGTLFKAIALYQPGTPPPPGFDAP